MRLIILFQIICVSAGFASGPCESTHPFSVNDLLAMERITDPQVSGLSLSCKRPTLKPTAAGATSGWSVPTGPALPV